MQQGTRSITNINQRGEEPDLYATVNRFMDQVDEIYSDAALRNNVSAWRDLLNGEETSQPEIKEILLYRTFYYFAEIISKHPYQETPWPAKIEVLRLFAETFCWLDEKESLTERYGARQIDLVFSQANSKTTSDGGHLPLMGNRKGRFVKPLTRYFIAFSLLAFLGIYILINITERFNTGRIPYYACKVLFTNQASRDHFTDCQALAETSDVYALMLFGLAQLYSESSPGKPEAAFSWLSRAASLSDSRAWYLLGALNGEIIETDNVVVRQADFEQAKYWLERSAAAGEKHAYTHLASLYVIRNAGIEDIMSARECLLNAANAEQVDAYLAIGIFEWYGIGAPVDYGLAKKWLDLYAKTLIPEGSNEAAWLLATSDDDNFRDGRQAAAYIDYLLQDTTHPDLYMYLDTIAAVHAVNGDFTAAIDFQKQAIEALSKLEPAVHQDNIDDFRQRLTRFQDHKAWVEELPENFVQARFTGIKNRIYSRELRHIILGSD